MRWILPTRTRYGIPGWGVELRLIYDPAWVDVPLAGDDTCTVMAHGWAADGDEVVFTVRAGDGLRETVRLPIALLDSKLPISPIPVPGFGVTEKDESYVIWDEANHLVRYNLVNGASIQVLSGGWSLKGPDVIFDLVFHGRTTFQMGFRRPVLRFPLSLLYGFNPPLKYDPAWVDVPLAIQSPDTPGGFTMQFRWGQTLVTLRLPTNHGRLFGWFGQLLWVVFIVDRAEVSG